MCKSSHQSCSIKKGVLRNFAKFTGKHLCQSLFFNKVAEKEVLAQVFSCEFCKISKNTFFTEHFWATTSRCAYFFQPFFLVYIYSDHWSILKLCYYIFLFYQNLWWNIYYSTKRDHNHKRNSQSQPTKILTCSVLLISCE